MLGVVAKVKVKSGEIDRFLHYIEADVRGSLTEPGCVRFDVIRDEKSTNVFYLFEVYKDQAAYAQHAEAPYFKAFFAEAGDTLDGSPEVYMGSVHSWTEDVRPSV